MTAAIDAHADTDPPSYIGDIKAQPAALAGLLEAGIPTDGAELLTRISSFDRVVLTGMGSSLQGMYPTYLRLAAAGLAAWCEDTGELLNYQRGLITADTLLWVTSQSGESAEVIELLDRLPARARPTVLAVTNDTNSALAASATAVLPLRSGNEQTVGTRSYVNTLAVSAIATASALGEPIDPALRDAPQRLADYLDGWDAHLATIGEALPMAPTFVLGRGASLGSARTAALIMKEAARQSVEGMSVPQFRHGPLEMADESVTALLFAGDLGDRVRNDDMRTTLQQTGARCVWIDNSPSQEPSIVTPQLSSRDTRSMAEIVPMQLVTVVLANRLGEEPGRFRQIDKITRTL